MIDSLGKNVFKKKQTDDYRAEEPRSIYGDFHCCDYILSANCIACLQVCGYLLFRLLSLTSTLNILSAAALFYAAVHSTIFRAQLSDVYPSLLLTTALVEFSLSIYGCGRLSKLALVRETELTEDEHELDAESLFRRETQKSHLYRSCQTVGCAMMLLIFWYAVVGSLIGVKLATIKQQLSDGLGAGLLNYTHDVAIKSASY